MKEWTTVAKQRRGPNKNVTLSYGSTKLLFIHGETETVGRMCLHLGTGRSCSLLGLCSHDLETMTLTHGAAPLKVRNTVSGVLRVTAMSPARAVLLHP